jgi:PAS domain S-box-containing protein
MTRSSPPGVLVLGADASVRHVDRAALTLLGDDREALFDGTAAVLTDPVSEPEGPSHPSLRAYLEAFLADDAADRIVLPGGTPAEAREAFGSEGERTITLTIRSPSPDEPSPAPDNRAPGVRDRSRILDHIATGTPLSDVLSTLTTSLEDARPGTKAAILLSDSNTNTLRVGAAPTLPAAYRDALDGLRGGPSAGSAGAAVHFGEAVLVGDIATDDRWADRREVALEHGLRAGWAVPIRGPDDEVLGTVALYDDEPRAPTEEDRALMADAARLASVAIQYDRWKQKLELQDAQFRRLVEHAQPIVFVLDAEGTFLLSEGEDLSALDLQPGERVGDSIYALYDDHPSLLHCVDRALAGTPVDETLEIGDVVLDVWFAPYYGRGGEVAGCIGMAVDVTERRAAEEALRAHRDLLRRTQELASVGGWEYVPDTDTMVGTDETYRICDVPLGTELSLDRALSLYPPDMAATVRRAAERCLAHGEPFDLEGPMTTAEDARRWVRVRGEARDPDDGRRKMVGTVQDLTERHRIEERLREQKEWLQSITENVSGGIYRSTEDGLVYANQALLDLFGYESLEEMDAADAASLYANPEVQADLIDRQDEQGGLDGVEVRYRRKDGSTFTGLLRSTAVFDEDGDPLFYDGVVTDITEQKKRERQFREQRRKIESMYGPSGRLLRADRPEDVATVLVELVHETFGYPGVAVRYARGGELVPVQLSPEVPDRMPERPSFRIDGDSAVAETFRAGETRTVDDVQRLDDPFDYGEARAVAGVPLGDHGILTLATFEAGGIDAFDLRLIDILARKATAVLGRLDQEAHLRASERRFRGLFEEAALGIALIDLEGTIVEANPELAAMLGYEPGALAGCPFSDLTHPDAPTDGGDRFAELVAGDRDRYEVEQRYVRQDDSVFWGRVTVSRHKGPGAAEVIGMVEDVSSRKAYEHKLKEAKREAEEASRLKSALLANMSHEIRTPLTSIIGFTGVLRDDLSGEPAQYAELAHRGGKRLMETLDSVLQLSKLEAGMTAPEPERIDLVSTIESTLDLHRSQAADAAVALKFESPSSALHGRWPPNAVQRILSNLLSNAIKFTPEDGTVTVRAWSADDGAVLEVEDTGVGISEAFRPRLFDAFAQESEGLEREHEGSGLGLAIVKRLVDLVDGRIDVDSTKGDGTRFRVVLPR